MRIEFEQVTSEPTEEMTPEEEAASIRNGGVDNKGRYTRAVAPEGDCRKCGEPDAFIGATPKYVATVWYQTGGKHLGSLQWECFRCGYEITTSTADETTAGDEAVDIV